MTGVRKTEQRNAFPQLGNYEPETSGLIIANGFKEFTAAIVEEVIAVTRNGITYCTPNGAEIRRASTDISNGHEEANVRRIADKIDFKNLIHLVCPFKEVSVHQNTLVTMSGSSSKQVEGQALHFEGVRALAWSFDKPNSSSELRSLDMGESQTLIRDSFSFKLRHIETGFPGAIEDISETLNWLAALATMPLQESGRKLTQADRYVARRDPHYPSTSLTRRILQRLSLFK